ncbi:Clathrin adaptor complex, small subunit [Ceraceosorus bombacis]|uniref:Clathrin adaptor complex, small subunit n=1 Tax=Ceraceosorus bombacis TaxID=401625 RepID=A0A0P1A444_9BASI|nr:Clathrin adaptor complex, small subunit [Ceraceosorus bombacis]
MAIHALLIFNNKGQPRLVSIYAPLSTQIQVALVSRIKTRIFDRPSSLSVGAGRSNRARASTSSASGTLTNAELGTEEYAESNFLDGSEFAPVFLYASGSKGKARRKEEADDGAAAAAAEMGDHIGATKGRVEGDQEEEEQERLGRGWKIVWRNYATLYFACIVDESESPLGILDLIQVRLVC